MKIGWKKGFTLIELLVVIAVLGVLAGGVVMAINPLAKINQAKMANIETFAASVNNSLAFDLVGEWTFNDATVNDTSGYGNITTNNGAIPASDRKGISNKAYSFDNDYVDLGVANAFNPGTGAVTWEAWFKTSSTGTEKHIIDFQGGTGWDGNGRLSLYEGSDNKLYAYIIKQVNGSYLSASINSKTAVSDGQWHHGLLVWDFPNKTIKLYLDGIYQGSNTNLNITLAPDVQSGRKLSVGVQHYANGDGNFFNGSIDDVRIYKSALLSSQVKQLYAQGLIRRLLAFK